MTRFARVDNGVVMEILVANKLPPFHPDVARQFVAVAEEVEEHWTLSDGVFVTPPPLPAAKLSSVQILARAVLQLGVEKLSAELEEQVNDLAGS